MVIAARNPDKLSEAQARLTGYCASGRACIGIPTDITQEVAVQQLVAAVTEQCESVDILINCAGALTSSHSLVLCIEWLLMYSQTGRALIHCICAVSPKIGWELRSYCISRQSVTIAIPVSVVPLRKCRRVQDGQCITSISQEVTT